MWKPISEWPTLTELFFGKGVSPAGYTPSYLSGKSKKAPAKSKAMTAKKTTAKKKAITAEKPSAMLTGKTAEKPKKVIKTKKS